MNVDDILDKNKVVSDLESALANAGLNQSWAAKKLDITKAYMSRIFSKKSMPSLELSIEMRRLTIKVISLGSKNAV